MLLSPGSRFAGGEGTGPAFAGPLYCFPSGAEALYSYRVYGMAEAVPLLKTVTLVITGVRAEGIRLLRGLTLTSGGR